MLTDIEVRRAEAKAKPYKLYDGRGLFIFVTAKGYKSWRYKYQYQGKHKTLVLGSYPAMTLKAAREAADDLNRQKDRGLDPSLTMTRRRLVVGDPEQTFEALARRWHQREKARWSEVHTADVLKTLERDLFPDLGPFPVAEIDQPLMLAVLKKVEARGAIETAHRLRQRAESVFHLASSLGVANTNPAAALGPAMSKKPVQRRWPALTHWPDVRTFLHDSDSAGASPLTRGASRLLALTAQRPGMIRHMRWAHLHGIDWSSAAGNFPAATWIIPAADMKLDAEGRADPDLDHDVPLTPPAVDLLKRLYQLTGSGEYVFWGRSSRTAMSENALNYLYKRIGYKNRHVPHGWRSSFSTLMNEHYAEFPPPFGVSWDRIIDIMLAHIPKGMSASEYRYNRAKFKKQRREIAATWASLLLQGSLSLDKLIEGPRRSPLR